MGFPKSLTERTQNSIAAAILDGAHQLRKAGVPEARREAGSLLAFTLQRDRSFILGHADDVLTNADFALFSSYLEQRAAGKPLQYITGMQEFYSLEFEVNSEVLIPRPETELLVETALKLVPRDRDILICDVGTGSGCIAITLAHELPRARALAIDVSKGALEVAKRNATRHAVDDRIEFVESDCFAQLNNRRQLFDLIVSNPPYLADAHLEGLQREVRDYEPRQALEAGQDGLDIVRRLLVDASKFLSSGGHFVFEVGFDQHAVVENLIDRSVWKLVDVHQDIQGIPRTVVLQKI